jgi:hypothetical protein
MKTIYIVFRIYNDYDSSEARELKAFVSKTKADKFLENLEKEQEVTIKKMEELFSVFKPKLNEQRSRLFQDYEKNKVTTNEVENLLALQDELRREESKILDSRVFDTSGYYDEKNLEYIIREMELDEEE